MGRDLRMPDRDGHVLVGQVDEALRHERGAWDLAYGLQQPFVPDPHLPRHVGERRPMGPHPTASQRRTARAVGGSDDDGRRRPVDIGTPRGSEEGFGPRRSRHGPDGHLTDGLVARVRSPPSSPIRSLGSVSLVGPTGRSPFAGIARMTHLGSLSFLLVGRTPWFRGGARVLL